MKGTIRGRRPWWWAVVFAAIAAASGASAEVPQPSREGAPDDAGFAPSSTYFTLRRDVRRCASPNCGGFFAKAVNGVAVICPNGQSGNECYVADLDLSALSLDPADEQQLRERPQQFLVRGSFAPFGPAFPKLGLLRVREASRGHERVVATGTFYRARNNGLACFAFPCPSITARALNLPQAPPLGVARVDLRAVNADPDDGLARLDEPEGLLLAAERRPVQGPGGRSLELIGSEYYLPFGKPRQFCGAPGLPQCSAEQFCSFPPNAYCGAADAAGVCLDRPESCPRGADPVCGCDGNTYASACEAAAAGSGVASAGPCPRVCGTILGLTCGPQEFCDLGAGQCKLADAGGVCAPLPRICDLSSDPVCGCDGRTYRNACTAHARGVQIDHEGRCFPPPR